MYGIDLIIINIMNLDNSINIKVGIKEKKIIYNNKIMNINDEKINELIRIIRSWHNYSKNMKSIEFEECSINIYSNGKVLNSFTYNGLFPQNYNIFKNLVGEICKI